jgi:hypothetical protein
VILVSMLVMIAFRAALRSTTRMWRFEGTQPSFPPQHEETGSAKSAPNHQPTDRFPS